MNINYISLGSFCHPKIFLRKTKREILKSLPFDFHSSPNTYSIYSILNKLHQDKTFKHEFKEIIFEHEYNEDNKKELAVSDKEDLFFLHFFDLNDKISDMNEYPIQVENNLCPEKIISIQDKFKKRYEYLYQILNSKKNILLLLRIENYPNKSWKADVQNLVNIINKYKHPNKFLIYTQSEIDENLDFNKTKKINYDFNFPIIFYKKLFDEKITSDEEMNNSFSQILTNFENIVSSSILINFNDNINCFYYDPNQKILIKLNNINIVFNVININEKKLEIKYKDKVIIFFRNSKKVFELIS